MLNLAMFVALGKPHELKAHVRGGLRNGVTKKEIIEVLIQGTIYCGIPAGIDAFRNAREALDQWDAEQREMRNATRRKKAGTKKRTVAKGNSRLPQ